MKSCILFINFKPQHTADTIHTEINPVKKYIPYAEHHWLAIYKDIEITAEAVLKRCLLIKTSHQLFPVNTAFKLQRDFKTRLIGFVTDIVNITKLSSLDKLGKLVYNRLNSGAVGNFENFNYVLLFVIGIFCTDFYATRSCFKYFSHYLIIADKEAACGKIRPFDMLGKVCLFILHKCNRRTAHLA